ncbi:hypothetical protein BDB00DRAFT_932523 [Zychaea mexicana]|uniref:uncharacterized protein n=1 Tax=Zychaea mexicana TaxID=64656 RepID=UPI0022FE7663|nr:uncharacterized protein BDB00DRAFT_932523 [Zychaea mexicana]KAI9488693.1 hypothetical protein BDB00DRAFT_932523 [Zychaea mexicana]
MTINETNRLPSLPTEIQDPILTLLTFRERIRCSTVCKSWQAMILCRHDMWQNLSTDDQHTIVPHLVPYRRYIEASSVRRVHLGEFAEDCWPSVAKFLLVELKCDAIQDVHVRSECLTKNIVRSLLDRCGKTLTRIYFAPPRRNETILTRWKTDVTPDIFMRQCPNLTSFTFVFSINLNDREEWAPTIPSSIKNSHLTELTLGVNRKFDPEPFLQAAPNLEQLALLFPDINMLTGPAFASLLGQHCPRLTSLLLTYFTDHPGEFDITKLHLPRKSDIPRRQRLQSSHQQFIDNRLAATTRGGLTDLLLHDSVNLFRQMGVFLLHHFVQHQHSVLKRLDLSGNTFSEHQLMREVCRYECPSLTHLTVRHGSADAMNLIQQFISPRCVPNLRSLHIQDLGPFTDDLLLGVPYTVEEFILEDSYDVTEEGLVRFLKSRRTTLRKIGIIGTVRAFDPDVLHHAIASSDNVIDELIIDHPLGTVLTLVPHMIKFYDIMLEAGKRMQNIQLSFDETCWNPSNVLKSVQGKTFLNKLDRVAQEWRFHFDNWGTITHEEYRQRKRTK